MNIRFVTCVTTLLVLTTSGGCTGMRNFLFGRGAACSNCATQGPAYGGLGQGPSGGEYGCGTELGCGREPGCGYEHEGTQPFRPFARLRQNCGLLGGRGICNGSPNCNCGPQGYATPYGAYNSGAIDPYAYEGEVIGSEIVGDGYGGYPGVIYPNSRIVDDNFDVRGERIIGVDPVPNGSSRSN